ncbi:hypothetical protein L1887_35667 [Cichorium endivia]|nr:hypothetical protein L1887_35667 [Cichorium endivia]
MFGFHSDWGRTATGDGGSARRLPFSDWGRSLSKSRREKSRISHTSELAKTQLSKNRKEIVQHDIPGMFQSSQTLMELSNFISFRSRRCRQGSDFRQGEKVITRTGFCFPFPLPPLQLICVCSFEFSSMTVALPQSQQQLPNFRFSLFSSKCESSTHNASIGSQFISLEV